MTAANSRKSRGAGNGPLRSVLATVLATLATLVATSSLVAAQRGNSSSAAFLACLDDTRAAVTLPNQDRFNASRLTANLRTAHTPAAIAFPANASQVAALVNCCHASGVHAVARGGGHSYEGYSVLPGQLVIDLSGLRQVNVSANGTTASFGGGTLLGPLSYAIGRATNGSQALPTGTCPGVGAAGLLQGGGVGMLTRYAGLTADRLVAAEVALANGSLVEANSTHNADLLWALRGGGGGNFGIATRMTVSLVDVPPQVTVVLLDWPYATIPAVLNWYLSNAAGGDQRFTSGLLIGFTRANLEGLFLGPPSEVQSVLDSLNISAAGKPTSMSMMPMTYLQAVNFFARRTLGLQPSDDVQSLSLDPRQYAPSSLSKFQAKSCFVDAPLSAAGLAVVAGRFPPTTPNGFIQFHALGGAVTDIPANATAFPYRNSSFIFQIYSSWNSDSEAAAATAWVDAFYQDLAPYAACNKAYLNYIDASAPDAQRAYYGGSLSRLQTVKQAYDPQGTFSAPLGVAASA